MTTPATGHNGAQAPYRGADLPAAAAVLVVESLLIGAFAVGTIRLETALLGHVLVVAGLGLRLWQHLRLGSDAGSVLLLLPTVAATGPFAAFGGLLIGWLSRQRTEDSARLQQWYSRIALSTETSATSRLSDHIMTGRALDTGLAPPEPFGALIRTGTIAQKQSILGLIARKFHPEYLPALQLALVSDEPVIRVQAAAVAAKIRDVLAPLADRSLAAALAADASVETVLQRAQNAVLCVQSGLMDDKDKQRTERQIEVVLARTVGRIERLRRDPRVVDEAGHNAVRAAQSLYENHLVAQRRFGDLRRVRKARKWAERGPWLWRCVRRSAPKPIVGLNAGSAPPEVLP